LSLRDDKQNRVQRRNNVLETKYISKLTGLVCLQNSQKELYSKYYPGLPIYVLRTGINHITQASSELKEYLCYIGSFDAHKGVENLIKAAALSRTKPKVIVIGGKNDAEISNLRQIARQCEYEHQVTITGWINKQEMAGYLSQVRIGIVSLEDNFFNRYITSPLKLFDYYSCGIPVIATDLPTTRELIDEGKTGLLFPSGDIQTFADSIDNLYTYDDLYSDMIKNVYVKAGTLLWKNRAKQFHEILDSLT